MILADFLPPKPDARWKLALQTGVRHAIVKLHPALTGENPPSDIDVLRRAKDRFAEAGITLIGLEGDQFDMQRIKQGRPGREKDFDRYRQMLENMGELGIGLLCYNFMARIGWFRTRTGVEQRGGALVSAFDADDTQPAGTDAPTDVPAEEPDPTESALWDHYSRFLDEVLPTAERAGVVMALHPDDPPISPLRTVGRGSPGVDNCSPSAVGRIFTSAASTRRAMELHPSPAHGVTFCQGTFRAMGEDLPATARSFVQQGQLRFVHLRDVRGTRERFTETFHDNGPTDMPAMIRLYAELGFDGPIRVDHVPTMAGESNTEPGYQSLGRLFAVGYLKGMLDACGVAYR
jgi:mannonate dehydratase